MVCVLGAAVALLCAVVMVKGDCYLHVPRGSNNRLAENTQNRNNANRMFDSQNNNKGGYNVGDATNRKARNDRNKQYQMNYFQSTAEGNSYFPIEWTNQHGCGENTPGKPSKLNCNMVLQFMCQPDDGQFTRDTVRDGTSTRTNSYNKPRNGRQETLNEFARRKTVSRTDKGMNEPLQWRDKCEKKERNKGLFTADQKLKKNSATATRQNPNGNRNGYECPEERDYYPYWHPSDWKDIAILTEDATLCSYYQKESFNVKPKHECREKFRGSNTDSHYSTANNAVQCAAKGGRWTEVHSYLEKLPLTQTQCAQRKDTKWGESIYGKGPGDKECLVKLPAPDCQKAEYTRVNHLGNSENLKASKYMWKLPNFPSGQQQKCIFRMRYNMSTDDYDPYNTDSKSNEDDDVIENDPKVNVGLDGGQKLQLALNTAQTGRTFQDRSHVFQIKPRTTAMGDKDIHLLTVRGKRGNIVQTYPAVEYDFVPNKLEVSPDDLVHMEWTGSNSHNNQGGGDGQPGDDGEGTGGTDRSNILTMTKRDKNFFTPMEHADSMFNNMKPVWAARGSPSSLSTEDIAVQLSTSGQYANKNELRTNGRQWQNQLNNAPASFAGMVVQFKARKTHNYGCTRNNNFSNRSQKGSIVVK